VSSTLLNPLGYGEESWGCYCGRLKESRVSPADSEMRGYLHFIAGLRMG